MRLSKPVLRSALYIEHRRKWDRTSTPKSGSDYLDGHQCVSCCMVLLLVVWLLNAASLGQLVACYQNAQSNANDLRSVASARVKPLLAPEGAAWWGIAADFSSGDLDAYDARLGARPASYEIFVELPLRDSDKVTLNKLLPQIAARNAFTLLAVEPQGGLDLLTDAVLADFAGQLKRHEAAGSVIIVGFAQEMNGSWYPWASRPSQYKDAFRRVAAAVYAATIRATMLFAPNSPNGYPFEGGTYSIKCDFTRAPDAVNPDCLLLDTDGDKQLTANDDMFSPYYPGDDVVDFVGLNFFHFGSSWPYGANVIPAKNKFASVVQGQYNDGASTTYDFYSMFCTPPHNKPMVISSTAALFNLCNVPNTDSPCAAQVHPSNEMQIKQAWWEQVFNVRGDMAGNADVAKAFPNLQLVHWFDIVKPETEAQGNTVDWSVHNNDSIRRAFLRQLELPQLLPDGSNASASYWLGAAATLA